MIAVALIAVAVVWSVVYAPPGPKYSRLPPPCALISLATLDTLLPHATATPGTLPPGAGTDGLCLWSGTSGGENRVLSAQVIIFGPASAITSAQQGYSSAASSAGCRCQGVTVGTQSVTGVGDQATALFIIVKPGTLFTSASNIRVPEVLLLVRSSNALIFLSYVTTTATGTALEPREDAATLTALTTMGRAVLATLARPAGASSQPIAPVSPEPHYAGKPDPCRMITAATLTRYAPGVTVFPVPPSNVSGSPQGSPQSSACSWSSFTASGDISTSILLTLNLYPSTASALQGFDTDMQSEGQSGAGTTVTGIQQLTDLGEDAVAIFQTRARVPGVELLVWSGNAELRYSYTGPVGPATGRAALLAGSLAAARDALAALANPAASAFPQGPRYASPRDPCTLIKATSVAAYLPGGTTASPTVNSAPGPQSSSCGWSGLNGVISLFVTIYTGPDNALGGFESNVQYSQQNNGGVTIRGGQPLTGLGQQAIALYETALGPTVDLYVLSGNAEIEVEYSPMPFSGPQPSRAAMLAGDIVMAREVLAGLPH